MFEFKYNFPCFQIIEDKISLGTQFILSLTNVLSYTCLGRTQQMTKITKQKKTVTTLCITGAQSGFKSSILFCIMKQHGQTHAAPNLKQTSPR